MSVQRSAAISNKVYIEIDRSALEEYGEIRAISEPIYAPVITTKVPRGKFEIVYSAELFNIMRELGNKKIEVLAYLLDNKDANNQINASNTQLAERIGCSRTTIVEAMKVLAEAGLVRRENSVVMVSPSLMIKGNQIREAYLMRKYEEIPEKELGVIESKIEPQLSISESGDIVEVVK